MISIFEGIGLFSMIDITLQILWGELQSVQYPIVAHGVFTPSLLAFIGEAILFILFIPSSTFFTILLIPATIIVF